MKRLLLSLIGAVSQREHLLQVFNLKCTIRNQEKEIAQLKEELKELQSQKAEKETIKKASNTIAYPSKDERIFINLIKEFADKPYAPTLTENNKHIGVFKDNELYISNTHLVKRYNEIHGTSLKILPVEFTRQALKQGFIKPSRWKQNPAVHRITLPSGKRVSHVLINTDIHALKQNRQQNA